MSAHKTRDVSAAHEAQLLLFHFSSRVPNSTLVLSVSFRVYRRTDSVAINSPDFICLVSRVFVQSVVSKRLMFGEIQNRCLRRGEAAALFRNEGKDFYYEGAQIFKKKNSESSSCCLTP